MIGLFLLAGAVLSSFVGYDYESAHNHVLPSIPKIVGQIDPAVSQSFSTQDSLLFPSGGQSVSSLQSNPSSRNPLSEPVNSADFNKLTTPLLVRDQIQSNPSSSPKIPANSIYSLFALCGREQQVYGYDKTDMKTGGDIKFFYVNAPSEVATIVLSNGTKIVTVTNAIDGCHTFDSIPNNTSFQINLTGDYNGTIGYSTGQSPSYVQVTCYPHWQESKQYDNFGNVIQSFDPPIDHPAICIPTCSFSK